MDNNDRSDDNNLAVMMMVATVVMMAMKQWCYYEVILWTVKNSATELISCGAKNPLWPQWRTINWPIFVFGVLCEMKLWIQWWLLSKFETSWEVDDTDDRLVDDNDDDDEDDDDTPVDVAVVAIVW